MSAPIATCDRECELGPAVLFDQAHAARFRRDDLRRRDVEAEATSASCAFLACEGARQFDGRVEIHLGEEPAEILKWTHDSALALGLHAPTGQLILCDTGSLISSGEDLITCAVPPGHYSVDLHCMLGHELDLDGKPLPGVPEPGMAATLLGVTSVLAAVFGLVCLVFAVLAAGEHEWGLAARAVACAILPWPPWLAVWIGSGERRRGREAAAAMASALRERPPIPSWVIVLRQIDAPLPVGGGLESLGWPSELREAAEDK